MEKVVYYPPENMNDYVVLKVEIETAWSLLYFIRIATVLILEIRTALENLVTMVTPYFTN